MREQQTQSNYMVKRTSSQHSKSKHSMASSQQQSVKVLLTTEQQRERRLNQTDGSIPTSIKSNPYNI